MYQTILVPLDGSQRAERVIPYVDYLAKAHQARIILVHAVQPPVFYTSEGRLDQTQHINEASDYLNQVAKRLDLTADVQTVVASGDPASVIQWEALTVGVDLVVMTTHGRTGIGRFVYGSVADTVIRHVAIPVLLVPAHSPPHGTWPKDRPLRVLISLDGSEFSRSILSPTCDLAARPGLEIHLARAIPPLVSTYAEGAVLVAYDQSDELTEVKRDLDRVARDPRLATYPVVVHPVFGPAAETIVGTATTVGADVIAMSTHGSGGMVRLVAGSVATTVIQHAAVPVLVLHALAHATDLSPVGAPGDRRINAPRV